VPKNLIWEDIESLFKAIGCIVKEGKGSRVTFQYALKQKNRPDRIVQEHFHRPHPQKEAKPYQIKIAGFFLTRLEELP